jgi:hypothetical protein
MYGYSTNNIYREFPPLMQDGRSIISSWNTESETNKYLKEKHSIRNNWEYRKYLTRNALEIMDMNRKETSNDIGNVYKEAFPYDSVSHSPYIYKNLNDYTKQVGYTTSDLKEKYLSREQLNDRIAIPSLRIQHPQSLQPMKTVNDY